MILNLHWLQHISLERLNTGIFHDFRNTRAAKSEINIGLPVTEIHPKTGPSYKNNQKNGIQY